MAGKIKDLTGQKFGKLTVLNLKEVKNRKSYWNCVCDCGNLHVVRSDSLKCGNVKSCGCLNVESHAKPDSIRKTKLYRVYWSMKERCFNSNDKAFKWYGARGIRVCDEWKNDFQAFYEWAMSHGYAEGLTIDRIDNDGNYEPSNCRWATIQEQQTNKRQRKSKL